MRRGGNDKRGSATMDYFTRFQSPVGPLLLTGDGESVTGLWIDRQKCRRAGRAGSEENPAAFREARKWLDGYFAGRKPAPSELPLNPAGGSRFQKTVWDILLEIPYGRLSTYGKIAGESAERLGMERMSAQAVGQAVGNNPISIIIPCHRVVGSNGNLTGYGGGLDIKIRLLELEGVDMTKLFPPKNWTAH